MINRLFEIVTTNKPPACNADDWNILKHVAAAYGFLIKNRDNLTFGEFAELIKRHYSLSEPHNKAAYDVLVKYSDN